MTTEKPKKIDPRSTLNNMQDDLHEGAEMLSHALEWPIFPGPQILEWRKVIPNSLTILALFVGLSSVYFGMEKEFKYSVWCILTAGLLDGLDGPAARLLKGSSRFGAELDSLADLVNFGIAPAILIYLWSGYQYGAYGWIICLIFAVCMACRLARFNAGVDFNASAAFRNFFMGVPAPAGGALVLSPMILSFQFGDRVSLLGFSFRFDDPIYVMPVVLFVSMLLVSRLPTFSSKMIHRSLFGPIGPFKILLAIGIVTGLLAVLIKQTWLFALGFYAVYIATFPYSYWIYIQNSRNKSK
ncbi:phosphatidylserine synthase [Planoprotostelium fungivorum]|uniref:Phosphatidylserine synthase n=1 Tax=Planoprotostelium fungivorum TaxID=1890364 RepID=A0A2P6NS29_9EUKA|nr:phosphatidylserine synthase [Planoprotostelium fungivorum]